MRTSKPRRRRTLECLEHRRLLAADPIVSEFMASNQSALVDSDGQTPDWIELHNRGDEAIDLTGWYLTDDPTELDKWEFPGESAAQLAVGEFLVVRASGEDHVDAAGNLHTSFKLAADGEYVALVSPAGTVVSEYGPAGSDYPEQFEDVSYGVASEGQIGYFKTPTPGVANASTIDGFVADTRFSVDRGFFTSAFTVDITSSTLGATIVYTTDGSEPV